MPAFADCEGIVAEFRMARSRDTAHYSVQSHHEGTKDTKEHEEN